MKFGPEEDLRDRFLEPIILQAPKLHNICFNTMKFSCENLEQTALILFPGNYRIYRLIAPLWSSLPGEHKAPHLDLGWISFPDFSWESGFKGPDTSPKPDVVHSPTGRTRASSQPEYIMWCNELGRGWNSQVSMTCGLWSCSKSTGSLFFASMK